MKDKTIRLLLVEDDKVDQMAFERFVKNEGLPYDYTIAGSIIETERVLQSKSFDIIISDYWLGDGTSFELFDLFKGLPVIVTTGIGNEEVAVEAMKLGACDYLIKDAEGHYLKTLPATVELALKRKHNEEELRNYHQSLEAMVVERTAELSQSLNQERNLTKIIEKSLNEILLFDADSYKFLFVNEGARANMGYSLEEFLEMTPLDIKPEFDTSSFGKIVAPLKNKQKEKIVFETVHRRKNGSIYPVEVHLQKTEYYATPVFAAVVLDITQRKKMEQRYQELVEGTADLITQMDSEGTLLYVNHMSKEIFGADPGEIIGHHAFDFVHPDDREMTTTWFENCQNRNVLQGSIENRQINQETGAVHDMLWSSNFHYDEQGKLIFVNGIARDITHRKQMETAIRTSEEQWGRTFNSFTDIVTLQDTDLRIVKANKAACISLDLPGDAIVGHHCYKLFHGSEEPCLDCPLLETRETFVPHNREIYYEKLGRIFLVSAAPVFDEQGKLEYITHVAKDVSDLKKLEKELFQAQKMEAVGTLAGGIAHDFNNILSAIIGYSEIIKNEVPADSTIGHDIREVIGSGNRAANLVKQILTFSRKADSEKQPLRPHLIVQEALKMLRATLPTTISIKQNIDPDCGVVLADPTNIHQITVNLCTNALHAMTDEKGTLSVSLQRQELSTAELMGRTLPPGPFVVLSVSDTGCGMDKATLDRIFDPYFTTKEIGKGTGLGLAVIHGIVQDAQGFIEVKSSPGEGSSFDVYLPVFQEKTFTAPEPDQPVLPQRGTEHILVVDDEPFLVRVTQRQLEDLGYRVTATNKSQDALEMIHTTPEQFDLLITDQTMPGLTGDELALAAMKIKPDLPVILCTGHSHLVSEKKALKLGIKRYITKPIAADELSSAVRSVLDGK